MDPVLEEPGLTPVPTITWRPPPKFQDRLWRHLLLFVLTVVTTTWAGVAHYLSFQSAFTSSLPPDLPVGTMILGGLWYSGTILAILGSHEMGHYFACRYYDVDASLPFFIPVPLLLTGTMGAFIRIREPIHSKRMLFDIGIAGPIAGFLVAVPALLLGLAMSNVVPLPSGAYGREFGEPLIFQGMATLYWGSVPNGYVLNAHPIAFAAWFGFLATALNLFPIGQLDGGHISYAVLGRRSTYVSIVTTGILVLLTFLSLTWIFWTALIIGMMFVFGPHHPRTIDEHVPLDRVRIVLAILAVVIFVLCFTPAPVGPEQILQP